MDSRRRQHPKLVLRHDPGQRERVSAYERRTRANLSEKLRAFSADTNSTASRIELLCSSITATV